VGPSDQPVRVALGALDEMCPSKACCRRGDMGGVGAVLSLCALGTSFIWASFFMASNIADIVCTSQGEVIQFLVGLLCI